MAVPRTTARVLVAVGVALALIALVAVLWATMRGRSPQQPSPTPGTVTMSTDPMATSGTTPAADPTSSAGSTTDPATESATAPATDAPSTSGPVPSVPMPTELPGPAERTSWVPVETTRKVTYRVSANGPAEVIHGSIGGEQTTVEVVGDWSLSVELPDADTTVRVWVTGTGATDLACEVLIDGASAAQRSGYGTPLTAICAANLQVSG